MIITPSEKSKILQIVQRQLLIVDQYPDEIPVRRREKTYNYRYRTDPDYRRRRIELSLAYYRNRKKQNKSEPAVAS